MRCNPIHRHLENPTSGPEESKSARIHEFASNDTPFGVDADCPERAIQPYPVDRLRFQKEGVVCFQPTEPNETLRKGGRHVN